MGAFSVSKQDPTDGLPSYIDLDKVDVYAIQRNEAGDIVVFKSTPKPGFEDQEFAQVTRIYTEQETKDLTAQILDDVVIDVARGYRLMLDNLGLTERTVRLAGPFWKIAKLPLLRRLPFWTNYWNSRAVTALSNGRVPHSPTIRGSHAENTLHTQEL